MRAPVLLLSALLLLVGLFAFWEGSSGNRPGTKDPGEDLAAPEAADPGEASSLVAPSLAPPAAPAGDPETPDPESDERVEAVAIEPEAPDPARPLGLVWLFQHATHDPSFPGDSWSVTLGTHEAGADFGNDDISAIEVPPGLEVLAFADPGESGRRVRIGPGRHDLEFYGLNDAVSSLRVQPFTEPEIERVRGQQLILFESDPDDPEGEVWRVPLDHERDSQLFLSEDGWFPGRTLSGAEIPPGVEVTFFQAKNGLGVALVLGPGRHRLDLADFNDRVQSLRVRWRSKDD